MLTLLPAFLNKLCPSTLQEAVGLECFKVTSLSLFQGALGAGTVPTVLTTACPVLLPFLSRGGLSEWQGRTPK